MTEDECRVRQFWGWASCAKRRLYLHQNVFQYRVFVGSNARKDRRLASSGDSEEEAWRKAREFTEKREMQIARLVEERLYLSRADLDPEMLKRIMGRYEALLANLTRGRRAGNGSTSARDAD